MDNAHHCTSVCLWNLLFPCCRSRALERATVTFRDWFSRPHNVELQTLMGACCPASLQTWPCIHACVLLLLMARLLFCGGLSFFLHLVSLTQLAPWPSDFVPQSNRGGVCFVDVRELSLQQPLPNNPSSSVPRPQRRTWSCLD